MNSRTKGSVAEREVAITLQMWWRRVEPSCQFVRTPLSGGWGNATVRGDFRASGDIMTTAAKFPFCVEIKRREKWSLDRLLTGATSPVWAWWAQSCRAAAEQSATPMLWLRRNREPWRVMLPADLMGVIVARGLVHSRFVLASALSPKADATVAVGLVHYAPLMAPHVALALANET
jgi:hypothetical protein